MTSELAKFHRRDPTVAALHERAMKRAVVILAENNIAPALDPAEPDV